MLFVWMLKAKKKHTEQTYLQIKSDVFLLVQLDSGCDKTLFIILNLGSVPPLGSKYLVVFWVNCSMSYKDNG